jgi:hypothetical protein
MAIARGNSSSGCGPTFSDEPPHDDDYITESEFRRADQRTRTADPIRREEGYTYCPNPGPPFLAAPQFSGLTC